MSGDRRGFHVTFVNGSNPYYHFVCPIEEHKKALKKWRRNYNLKLVTINEDIEYYEAEEKSRGN